MMQPGIKAVAKTAANSHPSEATLRQYADQPNTRQRRAGLAIQAVRTGFWTPTQFTQLADMYIDTGYMNKPDIQDTKAGTFVNGVRVAGSDAPQEGLKPAQVIGEVTSLVKNVVGPKQMAEYGTTLIAQLVSQTGPGGSLAGKNPNEIAQATLLAVDLFKGASGQDNWLQKWIGEIPFVGTPLASFAGVEPKLTQGWMVQLGAEYHLAGGDLNGSPVSKYKNLDDAVGAATQIFNMTRGGGKPTADQITDIWLGVQEEFSGLDWPLNQKLDRYRQVLQTRAKQD